MDRQLSDMFQTSRFNPIYDLENDKNDEHVNSKPADLDDTGKQPATTPLAPKQANTAAPILNSSKHTTLIIEDTPNPNIHPHKDEGLTSANDQNHTLGYPPNPPSKKEKMQANRDTSTDIIIAEDMIVVDDNIHDLEGIEL
ncbi:hypothetical protein V6N11_050123 [Hibiscus sabdariffa]|uniref:Uncharacterized protein n=1 Tax=Hibiscus sabdariffa TaxID=183260 RepID=A0ABR2T8W8_9ROSI